MKEFFSELDGGVIVLGVIVIVSITMTLFIQWLNVM